jgi:hypothetical protein
MFKGKKTYIMAALAVITAIATYLTGDITIAEASQISLTAILGATVRSGVTTEVGKKLMLSFLCVGMLFAFTPKQAQAEPFALFAFTVIGGGWVALTYEDCKVNGVGLEDCAKNTWRNRKPLDYSKMND